LGHLGVSSGGLRSLGSSAQSELGRTEVVGVAQWAEVRRLRFVKGLSQREIRRRTGLHRDTIRKALKSKKPPVYRRALAGSKLDPFKDEIHRLLSEDPRLSGVRIRELLEPLGCTASKTIVDDYLREVRPLFAPPVRTFQRTHYRPGEFCQFDVWRPREEVPVGHGQTRRGWGRDRVSGLLARRRRGVGVLDTGRGSAGRDRRLHAAPGRSAAGAGVGSPGGHPRPRRSDLWPLGH
jgi:transcriptional regulator with XRE-family HTH domain